MWEEELEKNHVLVMVYQIFLDALTLGKIFLYEVNLLIVDEAHHVGAQKSNSPLRKILFLYDNFELKNDVRLVGLTASLINWKPKLKGDLKNQISTHIEDLKAAYGGNCYTGSLEEALNEYAARPEIKWAVYGGSVNLPIDIEQVRLYLESLHSKFNDMSKDQRFKIFKDLFMFKKLAQWMERLRTIFEEVLIYPIDVLMKIYRLVSYARSAFGQQ